VLVPDQSMNAMRYFPMYGLDSFLFFSLML
jgi:hypothetical protein